MATGTLGCHLSTNSQKEHATQSPLPVPPEDRLELRYYDILTVVAATTAVCVNMLALKVVRIGQLTFGGAVVFFPITYILGDVLTEVYGFRRARRVIWLSFGAQLYAAAMSWAVLAMPPAP